jgi:hypothetical protein
VTDLLLGVLLVLNLGMLAGVAYVLIFAPFYRYDPTQTARLLAARFLELSGGEFAEPQAADWVRREYVTVSATFGLPLSAAEAVIEGAMAILTESHREQPTISEGAGLYD